MPNLKAMTLLTGLLTALLAATTTLAADKLKTGQWEMTGNMHMTNLPNIPPEQIEQLRGLGIDVPVNDKTMTLQQCVTAEQASLDKAFDNIQSIEGCAVKNYKRTGNKVIADLSCTGDVKATGKFNMTLNGDTSYHGTVTITGTSEQMGMLDSTTHTSGKWIKAQCDEGIPIYGQ
ncbi:MAG: DUF3617 domain-containing protein [Candidatus Methylopumilus sp.]|jgi:hypothetical protein